VTLVEGFTGPDGTVIAYPGQRINPMDAVPFDQLVIVIDGTDPRQVAWARRKSDEATGVAVTVVTTRISRDDGWNHYTGMVVALDQPIYLIPAEMVERFRLERVPATVEGGNRVLIVREYAANEI
jgi:conjugal transfer pilus assembly protein TraW